jgi:hypothetical protein
MRLTVFVCVLFLFPPPPIPAVDSSIAAPEWNELPNRTEQIYLSSTQNGVCHFFLRRIIHWTEVTEIVDLVFCWSDIHEWLFSGSQWLRDLRRARSGPFERVGRGFGATRSIDICASFCVSFCLALGRKRPCEGPTPCPGSRMSERFHSYRN